MVVTNPKTTSSEGGSAVHQAWFAATASLTLPILQLSTISDIEWRQVSHEEVHRF